MIFRCLLNSVAAFPPENALYFRNLILVNFYWFSNRQKTWSRDFLRRGCEVADDPDLVVVDVEDDGFVELHGVGLDVGCHKWKIGA